ncbi:MAG: hypothetical protein KGH74_05590, partial [Candidatus Micrarchaeota archaeon]|nr:hypothetical protein [Candidatus Micrarchaeota archaeon]
MGKYVLVAPSSRPEAMAWLTSHPSLQQPLAQILPEASSSWTSAPALASPKLAAEAGLLQGLNNVLLTKIPHALGQTYLSMVESVLPGYSPYVQYSGSTSQYLQQTMVALNTLQTEFNQYKAQNIPTKELIREEVSHITQITPVQEITKQLIEQTQVTQEKQITVQPADLTHIQDQLLAVQGDIASLRNQLNSLNTSPGNVNVTNIYQTGGSNLNLHTLGSGAIELTAAQGVYIDGGSVYITATPPAGAKGVVLIKSDTAELTGTLTVDALSSLNSLAVTNNATIGGTLGVTGNTTLSGTLQTTGAATLSSTLGVTGATTLADLTSTGNVQVNGSETLNGNATLKGNTTLGTNNANTVTLNSPADFASTIASSFIPSAPAAYDLGSAVNKWNNLYVLTISSAGISSSGQAVFNYQPPTIALTDSSVLINPTAPLPTANVALLGISISGVEKARINSNGYLGLNGANDPANAYIINAGAPLQVTTGGALTTGAGITATTGNIALTLGNLTLGGTTRISNTGVGSFITGTTIGSQTFTTNNIADSGALTIASGAASNLTLASGTTGNVSLDSGSTGNVNVGTGNNAKTINIGTGNAGNIINIG